ncbi:MAG: sigma 54-interacting transcriptional regulator [Deltaproteobacteria bacterium]|nr:sigma 54-interacting transcriptional regulator [Deltaproteobacteria bacterium]
MADELRDLMTITREPRSSKKSERAEARLAVVHPLELAAWKAVGPKRLVVGRNPEDDGLALVHGTVSRQHARFDWDGHRHVLVDLDSRNGTHVNGVRLSSGAERPIEDNDVISFGDVICVYERGLAPAPSVLIREDAVPGNARATRELRARLQQAAKDPSPVLLIGETGVGKEHIAREVHRASGRRGPLVAVNVTELSPNLVESQLFGHERGAFTGADRPHPGLFRAAEHGTILLDEIGELAIELQPKLLRVLQEGEVRPVGATKAVPVDVRVVAATNRDLAADIEEERFRRDLHARLALWEIPVPPLRERRADILSWLERLYALWRHRRGLAPGRLPELEAHAVERILIARWDDNLRGLDRLTHHVATLVDGDDVVTVAMIEAHLGEDEAPGASSGGSSGGGGASAGGGASERPQAPTTREELEAVMAQVGGSVRAAAKHYGRERRQIYRWLDRFGLRADD